jgi:hypothetical protein
MRESKDTANPVLLNPWRVVKGPLNLLLISEDTHLGREKEKGKNISSGPW